MRQFRLMIMVSRAVAVMAFLLAYVSPGKASASTCEDGGNVKKNEAASSFEAFISEVLQVPSGQTNVVYYAGTSNGVSVLVHETNQGERQWNIANARLGKIYLREFTPCKAYWTVLKSNTAKRLSCWDECQQIRDYVNGLPPCSALVEPQSSWYETDSIPDTQTGCVYLRQDSVVCYSLCKELKKGDRILSQELLDVTQPSNSFIVAQMRKSQTTRWGEKQIKGDLSLVVWSGGRFCTGPKDSARKMYCVGDELIAPIRVHWDLWCDGLIGFNETMAIECYKRRATDSAVN